MTIFETSSFWFFAILIAANVGAIIFAGLRTKAKHKAHKKYWDALDQQQYPMPSGSMSDRVSP